jgi:hypothetical protein
LLGWSPCINLEDALKWTLESFLEEHNLSLSWQT